MKSAISFTLLFLATNLGYSQEHLLPISGNRGIPGTVTGSFIFEWENIPDALAYEYVITNNELCFAGCPGDTRQAITNNTQAVEYALLDSTFYFWITRIIYEVGDTSEWTLPSFFLAIAPDQSVPIAIAEPTRNEENLRIRFDWGALSETDFLTLEILDMYGRRVKLFPDVFRRQGVAQRFIFQELAIGEVGGGIYILRAHVRFREGEEEFIDVKFRHR